MKMRFTDKVVFKTTDKTTKVPTRATEHSAGHDFYMPKTITIPAKKAAMFDTNITTDIPKGYVMHLYPRSSLGIKKSLMLCNTVGIIDSDYKDTIKCALYNYGDTDVTLDKDERFMQAVTNPYIVSVDEPTTKNRTGGIGSTGK